ncbi:MAG: pyruvate formate lyase family protein [Anaerocolumna sp.]
MLNTDKVLLSPLFKQRINNLHEDKLKINEVKMKELGTLDFDDWGFVHYPGFKFEARPNHDSGIVYGSLAIGEHLRRFFNEIPKYINKNSALAGAWIGPLSNYVRIEIIPEDQSVELKEIWEKYDTRPGFGGMNHCAGDISIGLQLGWGGLLKKIRYYRKINTPVNTDFYDGEEQVVLGMQEWISALALEAHKLAELEKDQVIKANFLEMAEVNEWLVNHPPRTLREACQFIAHFQTLDRTYFVGGALDQLDEALRQFYEKDIQGGKLTDEEAVWYIASLFFNDTHYSQIAGLTPDGSKDMTSRMSFIILDAMHELHIPINIALRVHDKVNPVLLKRSLEYTLEDGSGVDYSCNVGCEQGYIKNGFPLQLARKRAKVGCNWTCIPGEEYPLQDVTRCNLGFALYYALQDIRENPSLEALFERFCFHTSAIVDSIKAGYDKHYEVIGRNKPELVYNIFMHGPIERGLNCSEGGVDILNFNIDGVALATVADSFAAIEQRIVIEQRITWEDLFVTLDHNYEGNENVRLMMKNIKRFGSPDSLAQAWAVKIRDYFVWCCKQEGTPKYHLPIIPGMFSHGTILELGSKLPATPNGRKNGEAISHSNEPDPGFAQGIHTFSPTLKANAVAFLQPGFGNSAPLHLDIDLDLLKHEGGTDALASLIHAHNQMGGTLINLNCLTKKKLLEAHEDPQKHPDLIVRVTGYSAFFASLSKEYRQQIVDRFLTSEVES